jgi:hypothetical protein
MYTDYQAEAYFLQTPHQPHAGVQGGRNAASAKSRGDAEVLAWQQAAGSGAQRPTSADSLT